VEAKSAVRSKLNWVGLAVTIFGLLMDPSIQTHLGNILPPEILSKIISGAGIATMVLRTFFTDQPVTFLNKKF